MLCSISPAMVTKYSRSGLIAMNDQGVDAAASLKALQGHLDEQKRVAAILALADGKAAPDVVASRVRIPDTDKTSPQLEDLVPPVPAHPAVIQLAEYQASRAADRARMERAQADLKEVELLQLTGRLVDAVETARTIEDAVAVFWSEVQRRERDDADAISASIGLDPLQARCLRDELRKRNGGLRRDYAAAMHKLANEVRNQTPGAR